MRLKQKEFVIPVKKGHSDLLAHISAPDTFSFGADIPVRFAITELSDQGYKCEIGLIENPEERFCENSLDLFEFSPRKVSRNENFNAIFLVPTGIGSDIGGHAGDATPAVKIVAEVCDQVILHPNVVNASELNEMPLNSLYVEGSTITRLLMGQIGLVPVRSNRVLVVIDDHPISMFTNDNINSINAARSTYGLNCTGIVKLNPPLCMTSSFSSSGTAIGEVVGLERLITVIEKFRGDFDALAVASVIDTPQDYHEAYFKSSKDMTNPWGGVEAMLTHSLSMMYNFPTAHSPMLENHDVANFDLGVVDPRKAAEAASLTFLQCMLKGLQKSPSICADKTLFGDKSVISAQDISCLVIPDKCVGLPTLAALEQGISVIAVRENKNFLLNQLEALPWQKGQLHIVDNYLEAVGVLSALKAGISPESVRRPFANAHVETMRFQ